MTRHALRSTLLVAVSAAFSLAACGGSSDTADSTASSQDSDSDVEDTRSFAARVGDAPDAPCDVVPVSVVEDAIGGTFTTAVYEFDSRICQYTGESSFGISWGPGFGYSVRANFERAEGEAEEITGLGDFAYRYQNLELAFQVGDDAVSLQGDLDMSTQGVALAEALIAELGG